MNAKPTLLADYGCEIGEGPLWHPMEQKVYWCDIARGRLFRYDPATGEHEPCVLWPQGTDPLPALGGLTIQADGSLLLFMAHGAVRVCLADEGVAG